MPRELIQPGTGRTNYYEKVCLQAPACEKAWIYERVIGYVLAGYDNRVVGQVSILIMSKKSPDIETGYERLERKIVAKVLKY